MQISHADEELLSYRVLDLSLLPVVLPTEADKHSDIFFDFSKGKVNEPVELRGEGNFFSSLYFFLWLRRSVPEVSYRQKSEGPGRVMFSIYDKNEKLRPVWIRENVELSREEKDTIEGLTNEISFEDGKIDMISIWQEVKKNFPENEIAALVEIFHVSKLREEVCLEGVIPIAPALAVLHYLIATRKTVIWNGVTIQ